jgi:multidrug efflux pump subunit AcrA (membrane-fusion protein)
MLPLPKFPVCAPPFPLCPAQTALQVPAPVGGVLEELLVADGDTVTPGMDLARIRVSGNPLFLSL